MQYLIERISHSERTTFPANLMAEAAEVAEALAGEDRRPDCAGLQWVFTPPDPIEEFVSLYLLNAEERFKQIKILWARNEHGVSRRQFTAALDAILQLKGERTSAEFDLFCLRLHDYLEHVGA